METNNENNKEKFDDSTKNFFVIMWQKNKFIQIFIVAFVLLTVQIFNLDWCAEGWLNAVHESIGAAIFVSLGLLLPLAVTLIVFFKTWQFWRDLKAGRSR
jgi:hypothetical protein